jgi:Galactose oxidase, central domain/Kelch motif
MSVSKVPFAGTLAVIVMALTAELALAATGTWVARSSPPDVLLGPTVAGLPDGRILIAGGESSAHTGKTSEAEVYDVATGTWTIVHPMPAPRLFGTAVALKDGSIMIFGGSVSNGPDAAVIYDPRTATWSPAGPMPLAIGVGASAIALADGRVLVAGGEDPNRVPMAAAEIFDPSRHSWSATGPMISARERSALTLLTSGKALVIGGLGLSGPLSSAQLYDPISGKWSPAGELAEARYAAAAVRLSDGRVLAAGGDAGRLVNSAELYDPATNTWQPDGAMQYGGISQGVIVGSGHYVVVTTYLETSDRKVHVSIFDVDRSNWVAGPDLLLSHYLQTTVSAGDTAFVIAGSTVESLDVTALPAPSATKVAINVAGSLMTTWILIAIGIVLVALVVGLGVRRNWRMNR